jgi:K+ transporter
MSMPFKEFLDYADKACIGRAPGMGVWLTKVEHGASPMLLRHIEHNRVLHETVVLLTFVSDRRPRVPFHERHSVHRLGHGFYRIQVRLGFMQTPDIPLTLINCNRLASMPTSTTRTITSPTRPSFAATRHRRWSRYPLRSCRSSTASRAGHPISSKFHTMPSSKWDSA